MFTSQVSTLLVLSAFDHLNNLSGNRFSIKHSLNDYLATVLEFLKRAHQTRENHLNKFFPYLICNCLPKIHRRVRKPLYGRILGLMEELTLEVHKGHFSDYHKRLFSSHQRYDEPGKIQKEVNVLVQTLCRDDELEGLRVDPITKEATYQVLFNLKAHLQEWMSDQSTNKAILDAYTSEVAFEFHLLYTATHHRFVQLVMALFKYQNKSSHSEADASDIQMKTDLLFKKGMLLWRLSRSQMFQYHCQLLGAHHLFGENFFEQTQADSEQGGEDAEEDDNLKDAGDYDEESAGQSSSASAFANYIVRLVRILIGSFDGMDVLFKLFISAPKEFATFKFNIISVERPKEEHTRMQPYEQTIRDIFDNHNTADIDNIIDRLRSRAKAYCDREAPFKPKKVVRVFCQEITQADVKGGTVMHCNANQHCELVLASLPMGILFPTTTLTPDLRSRSLIDHLKLRPAQQVGLFLLSFFIPSLTLYLEDVEDLPTHITVSKFCCPVCWDVLDILRRQSTSNPSHIESRFFVRGRHSVIYPVILPTWLSSVVRGQSLHKYEDDLRRMLQSFVKDSESNVHEILPVRSTSDDLAAIESDPGMSSDTGSQYSDENVGFGRWD